jgi:cellobiose-specific phosphotransferase system component IIA
MHNNKTDIQTNDDIRQLSSMIGSEYRHNMMTGMNVDDTTYNEEQASYPLPQIHSNDNFMTTNNEHHQGNININHDETTVILLLTHAESLLAETIYQIIGMTTFVVKWMR